jgi:extradiol dioxygenase family protein
MVQHAAANNAATNDSNTGMGFHEGRSTDDFISFDYFDD